MFGSTFNNDNSFFGGGGTQFGQGGGFMPSQPADAAQTNRKFNDHSLRAVTIKQIKQATENLPDDIVLIDGEKLNNVTLVARVLSMQQQQTHYDLQVDDGTGRTDVKLYDDADDDSAFSKRKDCEVGRYVRIHGHLRPMDNKYPLVAFSIKPIIDFNEVTYHFLSCIAQHAHFTKGAGKTQQAAPPSSSKPAAPTGGFGGGFDDDEKDPVVLAVRNVFDASNGPLSIAAVQQSLAGRYNYQQVRDASSRLADAGHVYTVTDDTYRSCHN